MVLALLERDGITGFPVPAGYEATTEISRKAWGVDFQTPLDGGKVLVGDKVTVLLSVQAILAQ